MNQLSDDFRDDQHNAPLDEVIDELNRKVVFRHLQWNDITPSIPAPATEFPAHDWVELKSWESPELILSKLNICLQGGGKYSDVRDAYCHAHIDLNKKSNIAPAFRTELRLKAPKDDPAYLALHQDQMVIDLHWLREKEGNIKVHDKEWRNLIQHEVFADYGFDFDLAWSFASQNWSTEFRVKTVLGLKEVYQCQLMALRSNDMKARFKAIMYGGARSGITKVRQALSEWTEDDPRMERYVEDYEALWLARELLKPIKSSRKLPIRHIAKVAAIMRGSEQLTDKTVREKLTKLDSRLLRA